MTLQDAYADKLLSEGYVEVTCKSRKYREFVFQQHPKHIFLGKAGAVRVGRNASTSRPVSDACKTAYFGKEESQ